MHNAPNDKWLLMFIYQWKWQASKSLEWGLIKTEVIAAFGAGDKLGRTKSWEAELLLQTETLIVQCRQRAVKNDGKWNHFSSVLRS